MGDDDKMPFYALGTNLAMQVGGQGNFKTLLEEDELDVVLEAFCENLKGTATLDARDVLTKYGQQLNGILQERTNSIVDRVKKDGEEFTANFLDCNEEAVKTDSGLIYCPMIEGDGDQPELSNTVEVHYHGTLTDGTVFDSSVDRGQTISFPLGGVIKGWQEGLAMMKVGGKATLVILQDDAVSFANCQADEDDDAEEAEEDDAVDTSWYTYDIKEADDIAQVCVALNALDAETLESTGHIYDEQSSGSWYTRNRKGSIVYSDDEPEGLSGGIVALIVISVAAVVGGAAFLAFKKSEKPVEADYQGGAMS